MATIRRKYTRVQMAAFCDSALQQMPRLSIDQIPKCLRYLNNHKVTSKYIANKLQVTHMAVYYWMKGQKPCSNPLNVATIVYLYNKVQELEHQNQ